MKSYAQNFEDVILWRALKHIENGFYIDIGANDPVVDSVSLAFYEHGWRGVHVEPVPHFAQKLRCARPEEVVIEAAIGNVKAQIAIYDIADTGLSTGCKDIALDHAIAGFPVKVVNVNCVPLSEILDNHATRPVHWLKIDVEGMEQDVIASWAPSPVRPWIVVVESTRPNSAEPSFQSWEPCLLALGYDFVYFDGLNRFYLSHEQPNLRPYFGPGPNFFDGFVLSGLSSAPFCCQLNGEISDLRRQISELSQSLKSGAERETASEKMIAKLERESAVMSAREEQQELENREALSKRDRKIAELEREFAVLSAAVIQLDEEARVANDWLVSMRSSTSWRLTVPVRWMSTQGRRLSRPALEASLSAVRRHPILKPAVWFVASLAPPVKRRLTHFAVLRPKPTINLRGAVPQAIPQAPPISHHPPDIIISSVAPITVSLRARQVLADLVAR